MDASFILILLMLTFHFATLSIPCSSNLHTAYPLF